MQITNLHHDFKENHSMSTQTINRPIGTDFRIMSWNILSEELTPWAPPIEERIDGIRESVLQYAPDAGGVQEISEAGYALLNEHLGSIYEFVNPMTKEGNYSYTGIAYNKEKYRLLDSDIENYPLGNRRIRIATWIYLEEISTERRLVLMSTHWDRHACNRVPQAEYMGNMVNELRAKYNCPVICTGDFNAREESAAFKTFIRVSKHLDAKLNCENPINNCFTGHPVGDFTPEFEGTECIDHVTSTPDLQVLRYEAVINQTTVNASDHFPLFVDYQIKK